MEALEADETPAGTKGARFITAIKDLDAASKALKAAGWTVTAAEIRYLAKEFREIPEPARQEVTDFLNALDDHEDVHHVYVALR